MRRVNTRIVTIVAGFLFLIFILSRLQKPSSTESLSPASIKSNSGSIIKFTDNKPASCRNDLLSDSSSPLSVSIVLSTSADSLSTLEHSVSNIVGYTEPNRLGEIVITSSRQLSLEQISHIKERLSHHGSLITFREGLNLQDKLANKLSVSHTYTKGSVIVFIEDTVLVSEGYLAPLLRTIYLHPWVIAVPSTNFILANDFKTYPSHVDHKWTFNWHLSYAEAFQMDFAELASRSEAEKFPSAVFDGATFALHRSYLAKLESMRPGLHYSSEIDLSFTSWLCGDGIYINPCSRIGQTTPTVSPGKNVKTQASALVAEIYLKSDKYRHAFQSVNNDLPITGEEKQRAERYSKSISACPHSFDWYMDKIVDGDVYTPSSDVRAFGQFALSSGGVFFRSPAMVYLLSRQPVSYAARESTIEYLQTGQLRTGSNCLVLSDRGYVVSEICDYQKPIFKWDWTSLNQFKVTVNGEDRCISHATDPYPEEHQRQVLMYTTCAKEPSEDSARFQMWNSFIWL